MRTKIGTRLMVAFVLIVMLMIGLALYLMGESRKSLEESVGKSSVFLAEEMLKRMNQGIYLKIEELQSHSRHLPLRESLSESNRDFERLADREAYINQKEGEWVSAPKEKITPFMEELIGSALSRHLRGDLIEFYQNKYGYQTVVEIIVTNGYGANVAQSGKTSDYRQDDEEWWQTAREKGYYVSDVAYDESAGEYAVSIGLRIDDEAGDFIGVMKAVIDVKSIIRSAEIAVRKYETTGIRLITPEGRLIYRTGAFRFFEDVSGREFFKQIKSDKGFFITEAGGRERLCSYARSKGYRDFEGLGWILLVSHDVEEILKPASQLRNRMVGSSLILIAIAILIALLISRSITKPLAVLTQGVKKIVKGDLDHRADVNTKDEIGELAAAFNEMNEKREQAESDLFKAHDELEMKVKQRTAELVKSNENLEQEIGERKLANERISHLNIVLRAIRKINMLIAMEKDRDRLIKSACEVFTETRGYHNAWIALLDESGKATAWAEAGLGNDFLPMAALLKRGELPGCCLAALRQEEAVAINDPMSECTDCPIRSNYGGRGGMCVRLKNGNEPSGIFAVSIPGELAHDKEEQMLFREAAADIAFALHSIELEEKHQRVGERLGESEIRYQTLTENLNVGVFRTEPARDGKLIIANPATIKIFGYDDEEDFLKTPVNDLYKHTEDRNRAIKEVSARGFVKNMGMTFKKKDGTELVGSLSLVASKDQEGNVKYIDGIIEDMTAQRRLEEQFHQAQKMESVGRLAGGVAHDFNNMLSVITGRAEIMLMDMRRGDPYYGSLDEIRTVAGRSTTLIRQLLAFARKQTIEPRVLDLNNTVEGMLKMLRRLIGEDIDLVWHPVSHLKPVCMDPAQIDQILANLSVNARDAIDGVGKIIIETENVVLDEAFCAGHVGFVPGRYVMLAVSDDGCGMEKEILEKVFEPFFTTKELGRGTGLGLSTVYGIVKQNQGFINVYSEPGEGTTFKIYMPRHVGEAEATMKETENQIPKGRGETILIVEDEPTVLDVAKQILERLGYTVLAAEGPDKAIEMVHGYVGEIDLLMTDVVMPEMSARDLAEEINKIRPNIKVLFMSGYTADAISHQGVLDKGVRFIQKPFTTGNLARKVRVALGRG